MLDEPNSNLDAHGEAALTEALKNAKAAGITVVTITQRPAALQSAEKIMLVQQGHIEAFGSRDEMLSRMAKAQEASTRQAGEEQTTKVHTLRAERGGT